jgi:dGTPase
MIEISPSLRHLFDAALAVDSRLAPTAAQNGGAVRFTPEEGDIRPPYFHDTDRIIHSKAYTRYIDKTQVFYLCENDHLTHRVLHVQLVSKIARTIGRTLGYNEDLIEAVALGHDVGHTPFGHTGERFMSAFLKGQGAGCFCHNAQSFRLLHEIDNKGRGVNLCVQTLDGILCHNGMRVSHGYKKREKTIGAVFAEYEKCLVDETETHRLVPMTMEGCIVRVSDIIAYIGRDIEDAITVSLIKREDLPREITSVLGNTNKDIVNSLIIDIINNSYAAEAVSFSESVYRALDALKTWNYEHIYNNPLKCTEDDKLEEMFNTVLNRLLGGTAPGAIQQSFVRHLHDDMGGDYMRKTHPARQVADYVSGMTDDYLMRVYRDMVIPKSFGISFAANQNVGPAR